MYIRRHIIIFKMTRKQSHLHVPECQTLIYLAKNKHIINKKNSYFVARINLPQTETADLMLMVMPASKM